MPAAGAKTSFSRAGLVPLSNRFTGVQVLKNLKKISYLSLCSILLSFIFNAALAAQDRPRVVRTVSIRSASEPPDSKTLVNDKSKALSNPPQKSRNSNSTLVNEAVVSGSAINPPLVKKTGSSGPIAAMSAAAASKAVYGSSTSATMLSGIQARLGRPYVYGSSGPNGYDCSGFVWAVFRDAGIDFTRQNVRSLWSSAETVIGDEKFKFGTLVFLNNLGHMGIVADENGFYHASSSKGVTYSPFKGYWQNRIVGFKRLPSPANVQAK